MNCQELWSIETSLLFSLCEEHWFWPAFSNINIILHVCHKNVHTKRTASLPVRPLLGRNKLNKQMAYVSHIASRTSGTLSDTLVPSIRISVELNINDFLGQYCDIWHEVWITWSQANVTSIRISMYWPSWNICVSWNSYIWLNCRWLAKVCFDFW